MIQKKMSKAAVVICTIAVLFAAISCCAVNSMRITALNMYVHPYTVTNTARGMRSRLLDMKRFVSLFLTTSFESEEKARELFEERYAMQNEAIEIIRESYLGSEEDVDALQKAMDGLIAIQDEALQFVGQKTEKDILNFIDENVYPHYDAVNDCLEIIIVSSDKRIYELTENAAHTAAFSIATALLLTFFIIFLTLYSTIVEQRSIKDSQKRERELQDALLLAQKANNAKKDFLSRMSHEIRTPLNAVIGMTTIAGAHLENRRRVEDCLTKIAYSSRHLLSLINDILDMSKIDAGKLTISTEPFRIQQLTESVISVIYPQSKAQGKTFTCDASGVTQENFIGDYLRVSQILLNLLSNAVKFTPQGGTIRLMIRQKETQNGKTILQFVVSDTGIGMSGEFLERLYLPFEQAGTQISQKYGGTGLGMAITYNLVDLLGGSIDVKSKQGEGTTFTVSLPFDLPEKTAAQRTWQLEMLRVLIADDDEDACIHANLLLKQMGIMAQYVKSGREAVKSVLEAHEAGSGYDVCIIDWRMPDMDGIEITRNIRGQLGPDTLIIIISAYDWSEIEEEARREGVNAFIAKPLFESSLYNVLVSVFGTNPSPKEPEVPKKDYTGRRFLLAEDNALNMEIAIELLNMTGAEVDSAGNGQEAVEKFEASPVGYYDMIFMDVQMPVMDGFTATEKIRGKSRPDSKSIPIVAMTANTFIEDIDAAHAAGMNAHIPKPVDVKTLYQTIAGLLETNEKAEPRKILEGIII
ncbi:MAG: response regulator [Clostridiaceae bacterium]|nr:response regulator [Clostridiaceae bacterium]